MGDPHEGGLRPLGAVRVIVTFADCTSTAPISTVAVLPEIRGNPRWSVVVPAGIRELDT